MIGCRPVGGYSPTVVVDPEDFFGLPPARVAVVLIDFQNDFCSPDVAPGGPVSNTGNAAAAVRANRFAAAAAAAGAHVLYTRQVLDLDRLTSRQRRRERIMSSNTVLAAPPPRD